MKKDQISPQRAPSANVDVCKQPDSAPGAMIWSRVTVRPARPEETPQLREFLREQAEYFEQNDISQSAVFLAEYDSEIIGFCSASRIVHADRQAGKEPILVKMPKRVTRSRRLPRRDGV